MPNWGSKEETSFNDLTALFSSSAPWNMCIYLDKNIEMKEIKILEWINNIWYGRYTCKRMRRSPSFRSLSMMLVSIAPYWNRIRLTLIPFSLINCIYADFMLNNKHYDDLTSSNTLIKLPPFLLPLSLSLRLKLEPPFSIWGGGWSLAAAWLLSFLPTTMAFPFIMPTSFMSQ